MRRAEPDVPDVPSPCIGVCRIDPASGWCEGCQRSLDEIAAWAGLSAADKRAVWCSIDARRAAPERPLLPPQPLAPGSPRPAPPPLPIA